ncbi:hypothetical protein [Tropicibacter sp. S64]|uniref:hypothetical protein n=1 Tax=Tropicibacter sp. S64 TaxID=3415122 RepID=UPI003C7AC589
MRILSALCLAALTCATPLAAQEREPIFGSYDEMRGTMDDLLVTRQMQELMIRFGGADEMTVAQLDDLDATVERLYPQDFANVAVLRRAQHENGFAQELIAYWTGTNYLYAYVFYHDTGSEVISINFRFNSDFIKLNELF